MEETSTSQRAPVPAPRSDPKPILAPLNCKSEPETPNEIESIAEMVARKVIKEATESVDSPPQATSNAQEKEEPIPEIVVTESGPQITSDDEDIVEVEVKDEVNGEKVDEPKPEPKVVENTKIVEVPKDKSSDPFAEESEEEQELAKLSSEPIDSVDGPSPSPSPLPVPKPRVLAAERKKVATVVGNVKSDPPKPKPEPPAKPELKQKIYPTDLNPFGDEEEEESHQSLEDTKSLSSKSVTSTKTSSSATSFQTPQKVYPTDLNPFGEEEEPETSNVADTTSESLNPFGDFDDEEEVIVVKPVAPVTPSPRKTVLTATTPPPPPPRSPRGVRSTPQKKRLAPAPPTPNVASPAAKCPASPSLAKSPVSQAPSPSDPLCDTSSASSSRTPTPVPRRSKAPIQTDQSEPNSLESTPNAPPRTPQLKVKKRPAPPIPAFKRSVKSSVAEMDAELDRIGDELPVVETNRLQLEHWLLEEQSRQKEANPDEEPTGQEYEDKLQEFIQFSIKRCKLAQKQKEFAYLKREHKLEEAQVEVEFNLRQIMSKQDILKTEEDKATEKELLDKLMEIIDERNEIVEAMVRAENLEIEEYIRMIAKVIPEQAKEMRPKPLHVPSTPAIQTLPEVQAKVHKHRSAKKILKNTTASTLSLLKLKKKKKKDKNKDSSMDTTDGPASPAAVVATAELSDSEPEHETNSQATSTGADDSLQASMASIDHIETETVAPVASTPGTKDRSESRASLPAESTKEVDPKKKKGAFSSLSKSTFKKLSPKIKASDIKSKLSNNKEPPSPDVPQKQSQGPSEPSETTLPLDANESTNIEQSTESNASKPPVSNGSTHKTAEPASINATQ